MGLGGYLTWTAAAREIYSLTGKKSFPFEQHDQLIKPISSEIFYNNPHIWQPHDGLNENCVPMQLNNPSSNYCKRDTPEKAFHRFDCHIINQVCEPYGIRNPSLKCDLFFDELERQEIDRLTSMLGENFIVIEPFSNTDYTPNRVYPFEKWQMIVDALKEHVQIVQVGTSVRKLKGCIDLTFAGSFRVACGIIGKSSVFIASEGGLVHGATAVGTKSVVVLTGYQNSKMVAYPQNINIDISNHGPCGLKTSCSKCIQDTKDHDYRKIIEEVQSIV
jgi:ADP-heptose:LPS heptosyltransferase